MKFSVWCCQVWLKLSICCSINIFWIGSWWNSEVRKYEKGRVQVIKMIKKSWNKDVAREEFKLTKFETLGKKLMVLKALILFHSLRVFHVLLFCKLPIFFHDIELNFWIFHFKRERYFQVFLPENLSDNTAWPFCYAVLKPILICEKYVKWEYCLFMLLSREILKC